MIQDFPPIQYAVVFAEQNDCTWTCNVRNVLYKFGSRVVGEAQSFRYLCMYKMEPFDNKHIEEYLGHNQHQRHFEILFPSAIARYFLDPCNKLQS
jgi:hypothetical protein